MTHRNLASISALALLAACSSGEEEARETSVPTQTASEALPQTAATPDASGRAFRYTRIEDCPLLESNPEEGGYFRYECPGEGRYKVQVIESDLRQTAEVIAPNGQGTALELSSVTGGGFSTLGKTLEWRGVEKDGTFVPDALILRHEVVTDPNGQKTVSYLVAVKLAAKPCVTARIAPGPEQNAKARDAADAGGACL